MNPSQKSLSVVCLLALIVLPASASTPPKTQAQTLSPYEQLARDIFRELVEINTTHQFGSTKAAEAAAARLKAAEHQAF